MWKIYAAMEPCDVDPSDGSLPSLGFNCTCEPIGCCATIYQVFERIIQLTSYISLQQLPTCLPSFSAILNHNLSELAVAQTASSILDPQTPRPFKYQQAEPGTLSRTSTQHTVKERPHNETRWPQTTAATPRTPPPNKARAVVPNPALCPNKSPPLPPLQDLSRRNILAKVSQSPIPFLFFSSLCPATLQSHPFYHATPDWFVADAPPPGIQYVQQATGQAPSASSSSQLGTAEGGRDTTSVEKAVDNAHPDQVSEFIREKYKSDSAGILKAQDAEELDRKLGADTE